MGKLNIARFKCIMFGIIVLVISGGIIIDIAIIMQNNTTTDPEINLQIVNILVSSIVALSVGFFMTWWGLEPLMPELKWGKDRLEELEHKEKDHE